MHDYSYPSIFLAYLMFFIFLAGAIFFLMKSLGQGYWGEDSEVPKYRMLAEGEDAEPDRKAS
jgi:hypothetical protein